MQNNTIPFKVSNFSQRLQRNPPTSVGGIHFFVHIGFYGTPKDGSPGSGD